MASINCFLKCIVERFLTKPMCWIRYVKCELNDAQRASIASRNKFGKLVYNSHDKEWKYEKRWFCRTRTTIRTKYTREWVLFWTTRKPKTRSRKWGAIRNSLNPQILKTRVSKILKSVKLNQPLFRNFEFWGFQIPRFEALRSRTSKRGIQKIRGLGSKRAEDFRETRVLRIFYFVCFDCYGTSAHVNSDVGVNSDVFLIRSRQLLHTKVTKRHVVALSRRSIIKR